jgi:sugar/nucleoside kinase (ribokinase family)
MTLLVAGWVAIDEIETPFGRAVAALGGSATCAALAAALFTDVRLLAAVGADFPDAERAKLERPGIDLSGLTVEPGQTSRWSGRYHYDMNTRDTISTEVGVNVNWHPTLPQRWEHSEAAFMAALEPAVQKSLLESLTAPRVTMVDTIRFYMDSALPQVFEAMGAADFVALNESETRELGYSPGIARAGRNLLSRVKRGVLVKLGEFGAAYIGEDDYFVSPGYPLDEVVDPTGAGDAFAGAFLGALDVAGEVTPSSIRRAVVYGSAVASFQVEGFGPARLLTLERDEVEVRYREMRRLTYFEADD